jgi:hypothetical protein
MDCSQVSELTKLTEKKLSIACKPLDTSTRPYTDVNTTAGSPEHLGDTAESDA